MKLSDLLTVVLFVSFIGNIRPSTVCLQQKSTAEENDSSESALGREKRALIPLIFNNGGVIQLATGFLAPTDIPKYQNINVLNNMRYLFNLPTTAASLYSILKTREFQQARARSSQGDKSREIFYIVLEGILNNQGRNGRQCVLRTICQVAEMPIKFHNGLTGEVFHMLFNPGDEEQVGVVYKHAKTAGLQGANCTDLYPKCPQGDGILDSISEVHELDFGEMTEAVGF